MRGRRGLIAALAALFPGLAAADPQDAVFKIEVPLGYSKTMSLVDAKPNSYDSDTGSALKRFCREGVFCLHFTGNSTATAFLDEEPDRIVTGLSEVAGFLQSYWKDIDPNRLEDIPVPIILSSRGGRVFGRSDGDHATVTVSADDKRIVQTESLGFNLHANSVSLKLSRPLHTAAPLRRALTRSAETLTTYGYSIDTKVIERRTGRKLSTPPDFGNGRSASRESKDAIGFADYEGFRGLLGAPVLNENSGLSASTSEPSALRRYSDGCRATASSSIPIRPSPGSKLPRSN